MEATLNQRLGFFPTKSRAEILPRCRRDYPLPLPINRCSVDDLREEKIESKKKKKPASSLVVFCNKSLSLSHIYPSPPKAPPFFLHSGSSPLAPPF
jgi:hypothetical protein